MQWRSSTKLGKHEGKVECGGDGLANGKSLMKERKRNKEREAECCYIVTLFQSQFAGIMISKISKLGNYMANKNQSFVHICLKCFNRGRRALVLVCGEKLTSSHSFSDQNLTITQNSTQYSMLKLSQIYFQKIYKQYNS